MEVTADTVRASLRTALRDAMRARDRVAVSALRSGLSAIDQAEAVPLDDLPDSVTEVARLDLGAQQVLAALQAEVDERRRAMTDLNAANQSAAAARVEDELNALLPHLTPPEQ